MDEQIKNEKTLTNIKKMFMAEIADMPKEKKKDDGYGRKVLYILNRLGMSGEKGGDDILRICTTTDALSPRSASVSSASF